MGQGIGITRRDHGPDPGLLVAGRGRGGAGCQGPTGQVVTARPWAGARGCDTGELLQIIVITAPMSPSWSAGWSVPQKPPSNLLGPQLLRDICEFNTTTLKSALPLSFLGWVYPLDRGFFLRHFLAISVESERN